MIGPRQVGKTTLALEIGKNHTALYLDLESEQDRASNGLDGAFLYRNTLHLIECKAANLAASGRTEASAVTEVLYKLDGLRNMSGLRTKSLLVDYRGRLNLL